MNDRWRRRAAATRVSHCRRSAAAHALTPEEVPIFVVPVQLGKDSVVHVMEIMRPVQFATPSPQLSRRCHGGSGHRTMTVTGMPFSVTVPSSTVLVGQESTIDSNTTRRQWQLLRCCHVKLKMAVAATYECPPHSGWLAEA